MKMYKDMNDIDGNDSVEGKEDANEVDEGNDDESDNHDNDDTNSGDDEIVPGENTPTKMASKPSYLNHIPNDWFFPGFMSFVAYGPFVDANDRLVCFETSDRSTASDKNRAAKRKLDLNEKANDRTHDSTNPRGYTTDQMFTTEYLRLQ